MMPFLDRFVTNRLLPGLLFSVMMIGIGPVFTAAQESKELIESHLEVGEFAPALAAARSIEEPEIRDHWLGRVAAAQAFAGGRLAATRTLGEIQSDLARTEAIGSVSGQPLGAAGGAAMADFDTLIELITSTIAPDSWDEVGGAGAIESFPTGVYVDSAGLMKRLKPTLDTSSLGSVWQQSRTDTGNRTARQTSILRKVSLPRLEKQMQLRHAFSERPDAAMRYLAGIYRIDYLLVYPQSGDIVIAGPAGDWRTDSQGRIVNAETGIPVLKLDDLVVMLRNAFGPAQGQFGCAIKPRQEGLAATKSYVDAWRDKPIKPRRRDQWLEDLRRSLGHQKIEFWGIDPTTHAARVIVEADYRMKLIGMGLEEGTLGVVSYLDAAKQSLGDAQPSMSVLRWWFALNYSSVRSTESHHAYAWDGPGVRVLSENELLTQTGQRVHTGKSDDLNRQFAHSFTSHFKELADKYPIYAELRNLFDLALVAALLHAEDLPAQVDWHLPHFRDPQACQVTEHTGPSDVESVVNCVVISRKKIIAGVSGGVSVNTSALLEKKPIQVDTYGAMEAEHAQSGPSARQLEADAWWWD